MVISDSVGYISGPGDTVELPLGSFLGELTNELEVFGRNAYITEFVAAGPKNVSNPYLHFSFLIHCYYC